MSIFQLRFQTHADLAGAEKLAITCMRPEYDLQPEITTIGAEDISEESDSMLAPHQIVFVKGWSRSVAAITLCLCMWEREDFLKAGGSIVLKLQ